MVRIDLEYELRLFLLSKSETMGDEDSLVTVAPPYDKAVVFKMASQKQP